MLRLISRSDDKWKQVPYKNVIFLCLCVKLSVKQNVWCYMHILNTKKTKKNLALCKFFHSIHNKKDHHMDKGLWNQQLRNWSFLIHRRICTHSPTESKHTLTTNLHECTIIAQMQCTNTAVVCQSSCSGGSVICRAVTPDSSVWMESKSEEKVQSENQLQFYSAQSPTMTRHKHLSCNMPVKTVSQSLWDSEISIIKRCEKTNVCNLHS